MKIYTFDWDLTPKDFSHYNNTENLFRAYFLGEDIGGCVIRKKEDKKVIGSFTVTKQLNRSDYMVDVVGDKIYIIPPNEKGSV